MGSIEQRHAVEHGIGAAGFSGPLLVIAGAGSGRKTNTLGRWVAHLIGGATSVARRHAPGPK